MVRGAERADMLLLMYYGDSDHLAVAALTGTAEADG